MNVYITDTSSFMPNEAISNDQMERVLGVLGELPSALREKILNKNQIKERYYAIDPETGQFTHTNAQMTAEAIRKLKPHKGFTLDDIECLCCGTSTPDQLMPGHGPMVHGELANKPHEVMTAAGVCLSGVVALKYAAMNVATGMSKNAVATGSERSSAFTRASFLRGMVQPPSARMAEEPLLNFEADFLRWMLSDGAGATFLSDQPANDGISLKIEWFEHVSYANQLEACMYAGAQKSPDGQLKGWQAYPSAEEALQDKAFAIKQDVKLLGEYIPKTAIDWTLRKCIQKYQLNPSTIDWLLPHYSSGYFRPVLIDRLQHIDFPIPAERWFTNLDTKGNTGAASFFIMLDELFHSGQLKPGQKVLGFIPESGRFSIAYVMFSVV